MKLHVIIASTRPGRIGVQVGHWFAELARAHGSFDVRLVDLAEIALPFLDEPEPAVVGKYVHEHTRRWSALVDQADAFVLVTPEYNSGLSAPLKNALDYLYAEWAYKPVGFVSYGMTSAGLRAVEMIKPVLTALKMVPVPEAVSVPLRQRLDARGVLVPSPTMAGAGDGMLTELHLLADALRSLRALRDPSPLAVAS